MNRLILPGDIRQVEQSGYDLTLRDCCVIQDDTEVPVTVGSVEGDRAGLSCDTLNGRGRSGGYGCSTDDSSCYC